MAPQAMPDPAGFEKSANEVFRRFFEPEKSATFPEGALVLAAASDSG
jgi:hypothetical protein